MPAYAIKIMTYKVTVVVLQFSKPLHNCIHRTDTDAEIALVIELAKEAGAYDAVECTHWADGGINIQILFTGLHTFVIGLVGRIRFCIVYLLPHNDQFLFSPHLRV